jgi:hypothetical protein
MRNDSMWQAGGEHGGRGPWPWWLERIKEQRNTVKSESCRYSRQSLHRVGWIPRVPHLELKASGREAQLVSRRPRAGRRRALSGTSCRWGRRLLAGRSCWWSSRSGWSGSTEAGWRARGEERASARSARRRWRTGSARNHWFLPGGV